MSKYLSWHPDQPLPAASRAVALGVFNGLHIGHRAVISRVCGIPDACSSSFLSACVLSLSGVPKTGDLLTAPAQLPALCETLGIDEWIDLPFAYICNLSPEEFVNDILFQKLGARTVVCGCNYRFGKGGAGDADTLRRLCEPLGISVIVVPLTQWNGHHVSSTAIRQALAAGDVRTAAGLLGRPFAVQQVITQGNRLGKTWGIPTINQLFSDGIAVPRFGVYASLVVIDNKQHFAVTNIGVHPTIAGCHRPQAETWIADFDGDLYGRELSVELIEFIRPEQSFSSVDQLKAQIEQDKQESLTRLSGSHASEIRAILFDFDDTLQNRPAAFRAAATEILTRHFSTLSAEEIACRAEIMLVENNGGYVNYDHYLQSLLDRWEWNGLSVEELRGEFHRCFPRYTTLFDETVSVLTQLRQKGYAIGIVTNGHPLLQNLKLDACSLRPLVDTVSVSGAEGVHKPDSEIFLRTAARLCVSPEQCVFVGDHPVNDIQGASDAGMQAVLINPFDHPDPPTKVPIIHTLTELLNRL